MILAITKKKSGSNNNNNENENENEKFQNIQKKIPFSALINKSDYQYCRHNKDANRSKHVNHLEFKYSVMQMMCLCVCVNQVSSSLS